MKKKTKRFGTLSAKMLQDISIGDNGWVLKAGSIVTFLGNAVGGQARVFWKGDWHDVPQDAIQKLVG